jgi:hypothetical protein
MPTKKSGVLLPIVNWATVNAAAGTARLCPQTPSVVLADRGSVGNAFTQCEAIAISERTGWGGTPRSSARWICTWPVLYLVCTSLYGCLSVSCCMTEVQYVSAHVLYCTAVPSMQCFAGSVTGCGFATIIHEPSRPPQRP